MYFTVGQKINVTLNKIEPFNKKEEDITDKMFSGNYLISAINHYVDRNILIKTFTGNYLDFINADIASKSYWLTRLH